MVGRRSLTQPLWFIDFPEGKAAFHYPHPPIPDTPAATEKEALHYLHILNEMIMNVTADFMSHQDDPEAKAALETLYAKFEELERRVAELRQHMHDESPEEDAESPEDPTH